MNTTVPAIPVAPFGCAHSPDERINIEAVDKFWKLLIDVLGFSL